MIKEMVIMDKADLDRTLTRIVHEILEKNKDASNLAVIGIRTRGVFLAERLVAKIKKLEKVEVPLGIIDITLHRDDFSFSNKVPIVHQTEIDFDLTDKNIILVDDVLFSGRTIRAALDEIMDFGRPAKVQLAVLIDRGHRELPIQPDFVGKTIGTILKESIRVHIKEVDKKEEVVKIIA